MGRFIGVDIRATYVRAVLLRTAGRRVFVERMLEVDRTVVPTLTEALRAGVQPLLQHGEPVAVAVDGDRAFIHRLKLPAHAQRQLADVLPYEVEAHVPLEIEELVYDYRVISSGSEGLVVMTAAARIDHVRDRIALCKEAFGYAPDRIGCGPMPLVNVAGLIPDLNHDRPIAIVDLTAAYTEVLIVLKGEPVFARTLSRGLRSLPEGAAALGAELRQTLNAYALQSGDPVERVELVGHASNDPLAVPFLRYHLGVDVSALDELAVEGVEPADRPLIARFAKAIALALSMGPKAHDLDLRQGPLVQQRGFTFLSEKTPLLSGLAAAILISFAFATWAEMRSLAQEREVLSAALLKLSGQMLDEETDDPELVIDMLDRGGGTDIPDPMPHADAFDIFVELSKRIPMDITHDIEELDLRRGKVKIHGVVKSKSDAQKVEGLLEKWECAQNVKLGKITQVVNSDNQKYLMNFDLACPQDQKKKEKKSGEGSSPEANEEESP
jgi:general secretion pathway protein L